MSDSELESDHSSQISWSASDGEDDPESTRKLGTVVWPEAEAKHIPMLTQIDTVSGESFGGLQLTVHSKVRDYKDMFRNTIYNYFTGSKWAKLHVALQLPSKMGEERSFLINEGEESHITVWCPHYERRELDLDVLRQNNWSCVMAYHPNLIKTEDKAFDEEGEVTDTTSCLSNYGFLTEDTLQACGKIYLRNTMPFPACPAYAHGQGIANTKTYKWRAAKLLPEWLTAAEQSNSMGFLRMTTYFPFRAAKDVPREVNQPPPGSYPFHVLIFIPKSQTFLRSRFASSLSKGKYFQAEGKRYVFAGSLIGLLNTDYLRDCPAHVQIPVIMPRIVTIVGGQQAPEGIFGRSLSASPSKSKQAPAPSKDKGKQTEQGKETEKEKEKEKGKGKDKEKGKEKEKEKEAESQKKTEKDTSPTPRENKAKSKARMKARAAAPWLKRPSSSITADKEDDSADDGGPSTDANAHDQSTDSVFVVEDNTDTAAVDNDNGQRKTTRKQKRKATMSPPSQTPRKKPRRG